MLRRVLVAAVLALVLMAGTAGAQTADNPPPTTTTTQPVDQFQPLDEYNYASHPISAYSMGFAPGTTGLFGTYGFLLSLPWDASRYITAGSLWLVGWVFDAEIGHTLADPASELAQKMDTNVLGAIDLKGLAFVVLAVVVVFHLLSMRPGKAFGEVIEVAVVLIGGTLMLANLGGVMHGSADVMSALSKGAFGAISDNRDVNEVQGAMQRSLVEAPWEIVNWGRPLRPECKAVADKLLADRAVDAQTGLNAYDIAKDAGSVGVGVVTGGPVSAAGEIVGSVVDTAQDATAPDPRKMMREAGCNEEAAYNATPKAGRIFSAFLNLVYVLLAAGLLVVTSFAVGIAQVGVIGVLYLTPFVLLGAIISRGVVSWWLTQVAAFFGLAVGASLAMVFHLGMLLAVMSISTPMAIYGRWALSVIVVIVGLLFFQRIMHLFRRTSVRGTTKAASAVVGPSKVLASKTAGAPNATQMAMLGWQQGTVRHARHRVQQGTHVVQETGKRSKAAGRRGVQAVQAVDHKVVKAATVAGTVPVGVAMAVGKGVRKAPQAAAATGRGVRKAAVGVTTAASTAQQAAQQTRQQATAAAQMAGLPLGGTRRRSPAATTLAASLAQAEQQQHANLVATREALTPEPPAEAPASAPLYTESKWEKQWAGSMELGDHDAFDAKVRRRAAAAVSRAPLYHRPPEDIDIAEDVPQERRGRILEHMNTAWDRKLRREKLNPDQVRAARALEIEHDDYVARQIGDGLRSFGRARMERPSKSA